MDEKRVSIPIFPIKTKIFHQLNLNLTKTSQWSIQNTTVGPLIRLFLWCFSQRILFKLGNFGNFGNFNFFLIKFSQLVFIGLSKCKGALHNLNVSWLSKMSRVFQTCVAYSQHRTASWMCDVFAPIYLTLIVNRIHFDGIIHWVVLFVR